MLTFAVNPFLMVVFSIRNQSVFRGVIVEYIKIGVVYFTMHVTKLLCVIFS